MLLFNLWVIAFMVWILKFWFLLSHNLIVLRIVAFWVFIFGTWSFNHLWHLRMKISICLINLTIPMDKWIFTRCWWIESLAFECFGASQFCNALIYKTLSTLRLTWVFHKILFRLLRTRVKSKVFIGWFVP